MRFIAGNLERKSLKRTISVGSGLELLPVCGGGVGKKGVMVKEWSVVMVMS